MRERAVPIHATGLLTKLMEESRTRRQWNEQSRIEHHCR